jgi:formamidopyrimidine-DNA glycosylase
LGRKPQDLTKEPGSSFYWQIFYPHDLNLPRPWRDEAGGFLALTRNWRREVQSENLHAPTLASRSGQYPPRSLAALMDQRFLAGIGNIYSDERLFQSGIRPDVKVSDLPDARMNALYLAMRRVLRIAIAGQADPNRLPESWLLPHRYKGGKCPRCGGALEERRSSGRTAYFCPRCQHKAKGQVGIHGETSRAT